ncbi:MAG TPA: Holliday junction resolvase RuvX [Streptosporangiaceae bacterium]|nr:Holliday junction resolvase RuvX [Streptosporangiaceae bacterium]
MRSGKRLAVDVGSVRIGVAACDPDGILATPIATVMRGTGDLAEIARLGAERGVIEIVVGLPTGLSGKAGKAAADARAFASELASAVAPVGVRLVDERFTTTMAHSALRSAGSDSRQRRSTVDRAAAALLLQSALDSERLTGSPAGELVGAGTGDH